MSVMADLVWGIIAMVYGGAGQITKMKREMRLEIGKALKEESISQRRSLICV